MKISIQYIKKEDNDFPVKLKQLPDCPDILYVAGNEKILNQFTLAVVGARKCTLEGARTAKTISQNLSSMGINIISGLADGIDTIAHDACMNRKKRKNDCCTGRRNL